MITIKSFFVPSRRRYLRSVARSYGLGLAALPVVHLFASRHVPAWWVMALEESAGALLILLSNLILPGEE